MKGLLRTGPLRYQGLVGTGGIGSGRFFLLSGNGTLGREESRAGHFLPARDYCKLHIISHYVKALLGDAISVYPIGNVGDDNAGSGLLQEMADAGLDLRFVRTIPGQPTLFSFCLVYPDGSVANVTTEDSAISRLGPPDMDRAEEIIRGLGKQGIALAAPEVPLAARARLLEKATEHGLFRAASFTRAEMPEAQGAGLLSTVDLLAVNAEEALALAGVQEKSADARAILGAGRALSARYPKLLLSVTGGTAGSWSWEAGRMQHCPALAVDARGTAGAGDAHFAGILCGLAAGLTLADAQQVGTIVAAASVTSAHTIHPDIGAELLRSVAKQLERVAPGVLALLDSCNGEF
ncbi:MAG TPA: PfkB family carbohydrate kinase [Spirochaetia bacterium]|nr:PfkB family carbohydrate kinase [Spirochaetia bacterium]